MSRSIWFNIKGMGEYGNIWCDEKCKICPFRFVCWTTYMTDQIKINVTPEQYDEWIAPHMRGKSPYSSIGQECMATNHEVADSNSARGSWGIRVGINRSNIRKLTIKTEKMSGE